jgi:caffeoyl-CoA O-methyltransferase
MNDKFTSLTPELYRYMLDSFWHPDDIEQELIARTAAIGQEAAMQTAPDQAALLAMFIRMLGARNVAEVGTFTGLSALAMARALPPDGRLLCCDVSSEWVDIGRPYWDRAGVSHRIDVVIGPALNTLRALPTDTVFDLSYIDADKESYLDYYEELLSRTRSGGIVALDNVLWGGSVVDAANTDRSTESIRAVNTHIGADNRVETVMLSIGDGLTIAMKR